MLSRAQRSLLRRNVLLARHASWTPTRLASPLTQSSLDSSSHTSSYSVGPPPLPSLHRSGHSLYTVPPLPPLAPPLPADAERLPPTPDSPYPTPASWSTPAQSQEQLAVLNACLASGDIQRAEEVARRIRAHWAREGSVEPLSNLLSACVHADFLRAYLSSALVRTLSSSSPSITSTASVDVRSNFVAKAWSYFDSLDHEQWRDPNSSQNTAIDASVLAVMLKGLVAAGPAIYDPSTTTDPQSWLRPITALLVQLRKTGTTLGEVLRDPIFLVELPSYLGKLSPIEVLDALEQTGQGRGGWEPWESQVANLRAELLKEEQRRRTEDDQVAENKAAELTPTRTANDEGEQEVSVSLKTLRTNLSTLGMPDGVVSSPHRQRLLEESSYDAARQLYIHEMEELTKVGKDKERGMQSNWLQGVMFEWMKQLEATLIEASQHTGRKSAWGKDADIEPFLRLLSPDKMALITIVELLRLCGGGGVSEGMKAARGILEVGRAIESEYHAQVLQQAYPRKQFDKELEQIAAYGSLKADGEVVPANPTRALDMFWRREMAKKEREGDKSWRPAWTRTIHAKVGSMLITALMEVAKVKRTIRHPVTGELYSEIQPAFSHTYQYVRGKRLGVIKVNPAVAERIDSDPLRITLHPRFLPMVVKPKPWLSYNSGAYLVHSTQVMRTKDSDEQVQYLKQASEADNLDDVFTGLDVLGSVSWKINRPIFDVVSTVWNSGEELGDIPAAGVLNGPLDVEKPEGLETDLRALDTYRRRIRKLLQERRAAHSNRCDINYKLEIARAFLGETFYFPHNLDFRGRAYPIPPNLSHIGDDMCRGLLMFGEAKPLGERGLRWLKIHLANTAGFDKASFDEREAYAMEHLEDVYDSADKPLEGQRWWLKAEDPWQCLATCVELAKALRSSNPTEYECALPIHQDGTCNGLQHYAALGGDLKGAHQVNLEGSDRPADVYSAVANLVNEVIERDAEAEVKEALILKGKVSRKVVKQTVMTTVYGVTFIGAKNQIEKQLKDRADISAEHLYPCSVYLGKLVLASITDVFKGATAIQQWLSRSARIISKSIPPGRLAQAMQSDSKGGRGRPKTSRATKNEEGGEEKPTRGEAAATSRIPKELMTSVVWTTPLGLPVVQPYRKDRKRQVSTALQTVFISDPAIPAEVDARAQATAFPPNFIHSLDATHMMMTALACKDKIAFASVHDSYWTHACSVDEMSVMLREAFIELHSQDILGKLRQEFMERYKGHVIPVSRAPKGLRYAEPDSDGTIRDRVDHSPSSSSTEQDLITELEAQDGPSSLPLFSQSPSSRSSSRKRVPPSPLDDSELAVADPTSAEAVEAAEMWRVPTSRGFNSKFVYVTDVLPPIPEKGDFQLDKIRDSLYFFS